MELASYSTSQLVSLNNILSGKTIKKFENRTKAEARIAALLAETGWTVEQIPDLLNGALPADPIEPEVQAAIADAGDEAFDDVKPSNQVEAAADLDDDVIVPTFLRKSLVEMADTIEGGSEEAKAEIAKIAEIKVEKAAKAKKVAKATTETSEPKGVREGTKRSIMLDMVKSEKGATEAEICERVGWKKCLVTLKRACKAAGVTLIAEREKGKATRYFVK